MSALYVVFRVAGTEYALPASDVLHMETFTAATRIPGAPAYVAGLVQVRGRVVPVVDLRRRFGFPPIEPTLDSRVIVAHAGGRTIGFLVDQAREVLKIGPDDVRPAPSLVATGADRLVHAVAQVQGRLLLLLDLSRFANEEEVHAERA